jgi:hypothetical protein
MSTNRKYIQPSFCWYKGQDPDSEVTAFVLKNIMMSQCVCKHLYNTAEPIMIEFNLL